MAIRTYLWRHYQELIYVVEKKLCRCSRTELPAKNVANYGGGAYPGCVYMTFNHEGSLFLSGVYQDQHTIFWDFVFDTIVREYPVVAMEAYLCQGE